MKNIVGLQVNTMKYINEYFSCIRGDRRRIDYVGVRIFCGDFVEYDSGRKQGARCDRRYDSRGSIRKLDDCIIRSSGPFILVSDPSILSEDGMGDN